MGSKFGWILAALLGGVFAAVIVKVWYFPSPTPPTRATTGPGMLSFLRPVEPISLALGRELSGEGDAGDDYQLALRAYKDNLSAIRQICQHAREVAGGQYRLTDDDVKLLKRVAEPIAAGATRKKMTYYFRKTPKKIDVPYFATEAREFQDLCDVPQMLAAHYESIGHAGRAEAEKVLVDMLVLGYHLMDERARMETVLRGVGIQEKACGLLAGLYDRWKKPRRAAEVRRYGDGLWNIGSIYNDLFGVVWRLERRGRAYGPHPGDIFNLVKNHRDRAVRVEAILALGVVKLTTATTRGDRRYVHKLIQAKLACPDAIERVAAGRAEALDAADLQRLANSR